MTRKLLPYEYDLIETLGVSKEEYLNFVAQQHIYEDVKEGTHLDIRNDPLTVSIVLAVVGVLFQVASILLAPKPRLPQEQKQVGAEQTRDQTLSPRIGFNGSQELAKYGDIVPLVYTNTSQNSSGGVRLSTLLLWSAILSFGNNQFMRLMMTLGASNIAQIDPERTALGQFPAKDLVFNNVWQYYNADGATRYNNLIRGGTDDPTRTTATDTTAKLNGLPGAVEGFSQAFSPTTSNSVGVTGFVPVFSDVLTLNNAGNIVRATADVQFLSTGANYWPNSYDRPTVPVGARWTLTVPNTSKVLSSTDTPGNARQDALRNASSFVDNNTLFKAGSAIFRVISASYADSANGIEEANLIATLECIRAGKMPKLPYNIKHWRDIPNQSSEINILRARINANNARISDLEFNIRINQDTLNRGYKIAAKNSVPLSQRERDALNALIRNNQNTVASLRNQNKDSQQRINELRSFDIAAFHTKGLAQIEEASYSSVTKCNVLDIALRFQVYRRISGRSNVYGSDQRSYGHSASDNGAKSRTAMFALWYRLTGSGEYARLPLIFCCRGFNEQNIFTYLKLVSQGTAKNIEIKLESVIDPYAEIQTFRTSGYAYLNPTAPLVQLTTAQTENPDLEIFFNGALYIESALSGQLPLNRSIKDTSEIDLFNYDAFTQTSFSFNNGPEIEITAVSEQLIESWTTYSPNLYRGLSNLALHVVSGAGTQDLRSVSVYISEGKRLRPISTAANEYGNEATGAPNDAAISALAATTPTASSSFAPDIFLDTILDGENGIGKYASLHSVDVMQLAQSKRFCQQNRLFMDGVIADGRPWREFWAQVAPLSLLELGKIGGKETLVPAVPYDKTTGAITRAVAISALFNQGNILEGSYKEEFIDYGANVQDVIVTVMYRDVERNGIFPRNNSVEIRRTDTQEANAIRETTDASQFITTRAQAILLGKFLCNIRRYNRRAIEFQTFPTDSFIMPGSFVYVETSNNQWDGIYTGRVEAGGALNLPIASRVPNGTYNVLTYGSSDGTRSFSGITVSNNTAAALASVEGQLFVLGTAVRSKRVFRITEVTMEEEGETTVRAVEHPCDASGNSLIAEGLAVRVVGLFTIDGRAE